MKAIHASLVMIMPLALVACNKTETAPADQATDTTAVVPVPTATETTVMPGATVAVPVPGPTVTSTATPDAGSTPADAGPTPHAT